MVSSIFAVSIHCQDLRLHLSGCIGSILVKFPGFSGRRCGRYQQEIRSRNGQNVEYYDWILQYLVKNANITVLISETEITNSDFEINMRKTAGEKQCIKEA